MNEAADETHEAWAWRAWLVMSADRRASPRWGTRPPEHPPGAPLARVCTASHPISSASRVLPAGFGRLAVCAFAAALALLLATGAAEAQTPVNLIDIGEGCIEAACPDAPTATATPGPLLGQITVTWMPAATGGTAVAWGAPLKISGMRHGMGSSMSAGVRSYTYTGLDVAKTYDLQVRGFGTGRVGSDRVKARGVAPLNDKMPPTVSSAVVNGETLIVTFDEAIFHETTKGEPAESAFEVKATPSGGTTRSVDILVAQFDYANRATIWLSLDGGVAHGETVRVSYDKPDTNPLRDAAGNEVESFTNQPVTNDTPDPAPPLTPSPSNRAPVADAGEDVEVAPGAAVTLDGSGSSDRDGDALTFAWDQIAGKAVALEGADTEAPSFEAPAVSGALVFRLRVSDPGGLTDADTVRVSVESLGAVHRVPFLPPASHPYHQGFVRVINHSAEAGEVSIAAFDDAGMEYGPLRLRIGANAAVHFNSRDLEKGDSERGLSAGVGEGEGNWRLELTSVLDLEVLAYVRAHGGAIASLHDVVPEDEAGHRVGFFNPGSNRGRVSRLRLINPGEEAASVRISGIDDAGEAGKSAVEVTLAPRASRTLNAQALESGEGEGLSGALGDGAGKWRLRVNADRPIRVMSLIASGPHLTNVSTTPDP